jgi:pimeloyl-ACP methyl ester carboxylesterase
VITLILLGVLLLPFLLIGGGMALFWKRMRRSVLRWACISYVIFALLLLFGLGPYLLALSIVKSGTRMPDRLLKDTPAQYNIQYEDIVFESSDHVRLSGWFIPPAGGHAILLCSHGLFRNRVEVLNRVIPLAKAGNGVLLYDSRSHGSSEKAVVSLGFYERNDVLGAMHYVRRRYPGSMPQPEIILMGVSMGAVAVLEAAAESRDYSAIILDSPFSGLKDTVIDHSWLFLKLPRFPFPSLFLFWFQRLAGFDPDRVNSHTAIQHMGLVPLLIIASEGDERIRPDVARSLYSEAISPLKKLEMFGNDVPHGAAARLHPEAYSRVLLGFLDKTQSPPEIKVPNAEEGSPR